MVVSADGADRGSEKVQRHHGSVHARDVDLHPVRRSRGGRRLLALSELPRYFPVLAPEGDLAAPDLYGRGTQADRKRNERKDQAGKDGEKEEPSVQMSTLVDDLLHISFANTQSGVKQIRIVDMTGRMVFSQATVDKMMDIDLSKKCSGIYLVSIVVDSQLFNNKIMKR